MSTNINPNAENARENARRRNGEFGTQVKSEASGGLVDLGAPVGPEVPLSDLVGTDDWHSSMDLSGYTPVDIDTELAKLLTAERRAQQKMERDYNWLRDEVGRHIHGRGFKSPAATPEEVEAYLDAARVADNPHHQQQKMLQLMESVEGLRDQIADLRTDADILNDEFQRRGGWTRAFLVTNANGHVHKSMGCSTCFASTEYHWATEFSGGTEADVVDAAGERACTVCYPSAPVDTWSRPTRMFTPEEVAAAEAKAAREQAKAERAAQAAAKSATVDGQPLSVPVGGSRYPQVFKTERAATTWAVEQITNYGTWRRVESDDDQVTVASIQRVVESLAAKHGVEAETVRAEFEKKATTKAKREGYAALDLSRTRV